MIAAFATIIASKETNFQYLEFDVNLHHAKGEKVRLKLLSGPGDQGEPDLIMIVLRQD